MIMKKNTGFTLVEVMVALVILAILMSVGMPQMAVFFKGNRMVVNSNDLLAGLHIARSEAIKRNSRVSICKSANAGDAAPTCATGTGGWEQGWIVFVEGTDPGNEFGQYTGADGDIIKVNTGAEGDQVTINTPDTAIQNYVSFTSRGVPKLKNGASQSGVFRVCDQRGLTNAAGNVVARGVLLNTSGRVRVTRDAGRIGACP
ncbi:MAG: GspH/FimT family pseudopilin [Gammaproteobacteria bacterium]|nr:GspH/FimT family pseudopilin [Gammaproteobacteria bacterium]